MKVPMLRQGLPDLESIDLCAIDFDSCLVPGISKVTVARYIGLMILTTPGDWLHLPRLSKAALLLLVTRLRQQVVGGISDGDLVQLYARLLEPLPYHMFQHAARRIPSRLRPSVVDTFKWLADRWPVGVVSLALDVVLAAVDDYLAVQTGHRFAFLYGNNLAKLTAGNETQAVLTATDKRNCLAMALNTLGCQRPLVIGHDKEDLGMVELAREMGGISIGINPAPRLSKAFDIVLRDQDWYVLPDVLMDMLTTPSDQSYR